jgi:hypothetical protein
VLAAILQDPEATGQRIGSLVDAVVDIRRLERTVPRNDEVSGVISPPARPETNIPVCFVLPDGVA